MAELGLPLTVRRKVNFWYPASHGAYSESRGFPVFGFDDPEGFFFGFPADDQALIKVAEHTGGDSLEHPDALNRSLQADDQTRVLRFLGKYMPHVVPSLRRHSVCMYTMTPDEHFIIDRHPKHQNVAFAAGFSGHGFKFAPVVGSVLADLALHGQTAEPVSFLSAARFGAVFPQER